MEEIKLTKLDWDCVQVIVWFDNGDDYEYTVDYFSLEELKNEYFIELLKYLLSHGGTKYQDWFEEFMFIPKNGNDKPKVIENVSIIKFEDGEAFRIDWL